MWGSDWRDGRYRIEVIDGRRVLFLAQDGAAVGLPKGTRFVSVWVSRGKGAP
jgi:hypothetical protein